MKLPAQAHTSRAWRIHDIAPEFRLEDVWSLPTPGARADFPRLVQGIVAHDVSRQAPLAVRLLFAVRWKLGEVFGWDDAQFGVGSRVPSLADRLPADLRAAAAPPFTALPFTSLYCTDDEFAAETANHTVHGVLHLGWVPDDEGPGYHGQLAILVKPNGALGNAYLAAIAPFRHLIVYPELIRTIGREWRTGAADAALTEHR